MLIQLLKTSKLLLATDVPMFSAASPVPLRVGDVVLGLLCLLSLLGLMLMKQSLGPNPEDLPVCVRLSRGLIWGLATGACPPPRATLPCPCPPWSRIIPPSFALPASFQYAMP